MIMCCQSLTRAMEKEKVQRQGKRPSSAPAVDLGTRGRQALLPQTEGLVILSGATVFPECCPPLSIPGSGTLLFTSSRPTLHHKQIPLIQNFAPQVQTGTVNTWART